MQFPKRPFSLAAGRTALSRPRIFAILAAASLVATATYAAVSIRREEARAIASADAALVGLGRVAEALWQADEARIQALLARLRIELRSGPDWSRGPTAGTGESSRRIDTLLRRALEGAADVRSIDWVVAGQEGLSLARTLPGPHVRDELGEGEGVEARAEEARSLWYADEVQAAVAANGRRIVRGPVEFVAVGEEERPIVRVALALHDADDVVQGALVAQLDLQPLASRLAHLGSEELRLAVATREGRLLVDVEDRPAHGFEAGLAGLDRAEGGEGSVVVAEMGIRSLLLAVPEASTEAGEPGAFVFWLEHAAPASLGALLVQSGWGAACAALALLVTALFAWDRMGVGVGGSREAGANARGRIGGRRAEKARASGDALASESGGGGAGDAIDPKAIAQEAFVLREWLADVRGCLEREAASRGLTLDLRCERDLPRQLVQDPLWLGGLLVSLGREALDATRASRVALEVFREGPGDLRFELDAGETELGATPGAEVIAQRLGALLEPIGRGRLAVRLPGAFA